MISCSSLLLKGFINAKEAARIVCDTLGIDGTYWLRDNRAGRHDWAIRYVKCGGRIFYHPTDLKRGLAIAKSRGKPSRRGRPIAASASHPHA